MLTYWKPPSNFPLWMINNTNDKFLVNHVTLWAPVQNERKLAFKTAKCSFPENFEENLGFQYQGTRTYFALGRSYSRTDFARSLFQLCCWFRKRLHDIEVGHRLVAFFLRWMIRARRVPDSRSASSPGALLLKRCRYMRRLHEVTVGNVTVDCASFAACNLPFGVIWNRFFNSLQCNPLNWWSIFVAPADKEHERQLPLITGTSRWNVLTSQTYCKDTFRGR